ncbi:MAG: alpha/beta hydrolase [Candidatus Sericytochromatia bacterium]
MYNFAHIRDKKTKINSFYTSEREVVLMLRGLSRSYKGWLGLEEDLSEKFDVICIDFPGVGLSKDEELIYNVDGIAEKIVNVINSLEIESFYLLAPSLGSMVAYEIALNLPLSKIKGICIFVPSHSGIGLKRITPNAIKTLLSTPFVSKEVKLAMLQNMLIGKTADGRNPFEEDVSLERRWKYQIMKDFEDLGVKGQLAQLMAASKYFSKTGLNYIRDNKIPTKFFVAGADTMIPFQHQIDIYEYIKNENCELIVMENSGHDFVTTHKDQIKKVVEDFILNNKGNDSEKNEISYYKSPKKKTNKGILFFISTLLGGILLFLATRKGKK